MVARGNDGSRAAWPDRQFVHTMGSTTSQTCSVPSARFQEFAGCGSRARIRTISATACIDAMAEVRRRVRARASADAVGLDTGAQADASAIYARDVPGVRRPASRRDAGLSLTTDIIVGFPGETDADFEETSSAVRVVGIRRGVHVQVFAAGWHAGHANAAPS